MNEPPADTKSNTILIIIVIIVGVLSCVGALIGLYFVTRKPDPTIEDTKSKDTKSDTKSEKDTKSTKDTKSETPINCSQSPWGECSARCGGGNQTRTVLVEPKNKGTICGPLSQVCNTQACPDWKRLVSVFDKNIGVTAGDAGDDTTLTFSNKCTPNTTDPKCLWAIVDGKLVSKASDSVAMGFVGNPTLGHYPKLYSHCAKSSDPKCKLNIDTDNRLTSSFSDLGVNAWNGPHNGNELRFHTDCAKESTNKACLWGLEPFSIF